MDIQYAVGYFDAHDVTFLQQELHKHRGSNHTFLMGHYPLSTTIAGQSAETGEPFEVLMRAVSVYMCGHLHKLAAGIGRCFERCFESVCGIGVLTMLEYILYI